MLYIVAWSCPTLCDPMDCSQPGSSVHGFLQARRLEWVAIPFSRGSSQLRALMEELKFKLGLEMGGRFLKGVRGSSWEMRERGVPARYKLIGGFYFRLGLTETPYLKTVLFQMDVTFFPRPVE